MSGHEILDRRVFPPGEVLFKEGETGRRCAYLVESGKVEISKTVPGGEMKVLGHVSAGGIFGEMALVDNKPRSAQAKTVEPTTVIIVTETVLEQKLRKTDPFVRGLLNIFVRTIRDLNEKMVRQSG
ncbi:MAG TPA: cyclic nucleotide-binding domain-containing protein [Magnetospirillaceae bacterium]|jgi:CRP-like cAMP-binding protein